MRLSQAQVQALMSLLPMVIEALSKEPNEPPPPPQWWVKTYPEDGILEPPPGPGWEPRRIIVLGDCTKVAWVRHGQNRDLAEVEQLHGH